MFLNSITANTNLIVATLAAMSVFFSVIAVSWPYLVQKTLDTRMREVAGERESIRIRERVKLVQKQQSLRPEPKKIFKDIFNRFNLAEHMNDSGMVHKLRMAGYRGQGPIITFVAARLIVSVLLFTAAVFYLFVLQFTFPFFIKLAIALAAALLGFHAPAIYVRNQIGKRQKAIRRAWPDAMDLLLICVESGMGLESALAKVSEEIGSQCPELAEEFALTTAELSYLPDRSTAFDNLAKRVGLDAVKALVMGLGQTEKFGTSLGGTLRVLAQESRDMRMLAAEKKAHALPPKLTVPMVLFFLPVLIAIIVTPAIIQLLDTSAQHSMQLRR